ncbi:cation:proton antiporter [Fastidiosibacter lacustris]|uniref:cation:proton antiporter n=1 Tax=Fastidiosibacter lacustris TaxID=2056695 RepID=UPI000E357193|nr:cation:proton antiporter [Fastidiosibacter lacustris]
MHILENIKHIAELPLNTPVSIFTFVLLLIIATKIICHYLRIPSIVGLIVAGVIAGPHALNILDQNLAVTIFATTGLLYIMFMAGLELEMKEFKLHKNKSLLFGTLTFLIPFCIGFIVFHYGFDYSISASILISIMFSTHTLVAYPMVSIKGYATRPAVAIAVGGTIITDTLVLLILAIITGIHHDKNDIAMFITLIFSFIVFSFIAFIIIPYIAKRFFYAFARKTSLHYTFVLLTVFVLAVFAEIIGVDAIIGAFFAGLALNRFVTKKQKLKTEIHFIGNTLFIPVFLISVGMIVNLHVLTDIHNVATIAITLITVALVSKWLAAKLTQWCLRLSTIDGKLIFGLSSAHAAATLAIILVGYKTEILDNAILNSTILLILVSCLVSSTVTARTLNQFTK